MRTFKYEDATFQIGLQTICDEECIVTKGYGIDVNVYSDGVVELYIGTRYDYDVDDITINNNLLVRTKKDYEQNGKTYEKLIAHLEEICNEREEIDFQCDDFHIKLWQTEDEMGAETVFVREEFEYDDEFIAIGKHLKTRFWDSIFPIFGRVTPKSSISKENINCSFSDITEALQEAVEYSKKQNEVTFDTFYNECNGKSPNEIIEICNGYENRLWLYQDCGWSDWEYVNYYELRNRELYDLGLRQIRRKK